MPISSPRTAFQTGFPANSLERRVALARGVLALERLLPRLWPAFGFFGFYLSLALTGLFAFVPWPVQALSLVNAAFCTVAPVLLTMRAVARIGAPAAAQAGMLGPVSTVFLGAWLLGEPVTAWQLAGSALVLAGMYVLSLRKA